MGDPGEPRGTRTSVPVSQYPTNGPRGNTPLLEPGRSRDTARSTGLSSARRGSRSRSRAPSQGRQAQPQGADRGRTTPAGQHPSPEQTARPREPQFYLFGNPHTSRTLGDTLQNYASSAFGLSSEEARIVRNFRHQLNAVESVLAMSREGKWLCGNIAPSRDQSNASHLFREWVIRGKELHEEAQDLVDSSEEALDMNIHGEGGQIHPTARKRLITVLVSRDYYLSDMEEFIDDVRDRVDTVSDCCDNLIDWARRESRASENRQR